MSKAQIGVVGMAVMGKNLALNIESRGYKVAIFNRTGSKTEQVVADHPDKNLVPSYTIEDFVNSLEKPRRIILMVKAGAPTDATIKSLLPYLDKGDVLIDGGNTFFEDTMRRNAELDNSGINFIGMGVSGGEKGALEGPSLMPGGQKEAYDLVAPILDQIAAKADDGEACVTYIGPNGAGHYVKMVHNGIEYGDMELIAESYNLLRNLLGLSVDEIAAIFHEWKDGELWRDLEDTNYYQVRRKWEMNLVFNGGKYQRVPIDHQLKNGENRRKKIFLSLIRRRLIQPTVTLEHMCYAALYELYFFIDNTDHEDYVSRTQLLQIAQSAMNTDLERYRETLRETKHFMVNRTEAHKQGMTSRQAVAKANRERISKRKDNEYSQLAQRYDPNKSIRENEVMLGISHHKAYDLKKWMDCNCPVPIA